MKPKKPVNTADLFRSQLSQMLNMSHPLVRLSQRMNWEKLESEIDILYSDASGHPPPLPTRLLVGLHYLKYTFNESDESVLAAAGYNLAKLLAWFYCAWKRVTQQTKQSRPLTTPSILFN